MLSSSSPSPFDFNPPTPQCTTRTRRPAVLPGGGVSGGGVSLWTRLGGLTLIAICLIVAACSKKTDPSGPGPNPNDPANPTPVDRSLPPLELRDETSDLLLTWIDDQGDFHVVQSISDVPEVGRATVRVVVTSKEAGTGQMVYVADLRSKQADGTYRVDSMSRGKWNELGAERRKVRMEALAPSTAAAPSTEPSSSDVTAGGPVKAVIYGASWCKPCHDAEALLKKLGVDVTMKDIEDSRAAQAEMQQKLAQAGRMGASIPVIDINGQLFVGFEAKQLTAAVKRARQTETL